jgi:hypothetical protein
MPSRKSKHLNTPRLHWQKLEFASRRHPSHLEVSHIPLFMIPTLAAQTRSFHHFKLVCLGLELVITLRREAAAAGGDVSGG